MTTKTTWRAYEVDGELSTADKNRLPKSVFAFPDKRKLPLTDAEHVRNALARFDQVKDVTDAERDLAFANLLAAARHYGVEVAETGWRQLGRRPHTDNSAH
ncbi:hypothetical protein Cme02nite_64290 [Catellatospora methionotrophica]|uniref:Uncharacterized protein n=1 Tax=Catellatospora methionotrophica TaxID=121620 RepID=A0A8J3LF00_9ACTN|nr:DUF6582 domain-containing protein [Catellatospora methionotrophica]GIG18097.1 hypothetical protein Cme02nite_64290 [Catellatospora methionotrophica]